MLIVQKNGAGQTGTKLGFEIPEIKKAKESVKPNIQVEKPDNETPEATEDFFKFQWVDEAKKDEQERKPAWKNQWVESHINDVEKKPHYLKIREEKCKNLGLGFYDIEADIQTSVQMFREGYPWYMVLDDIRSYCPALTLQQFVFDKAKAIIEEENIVRYFDGEPVEQPRPRPSGGAKAYRPKF